MREMARILLHYRKLTGNDSATLQSILKPARIGDFIRAVRDIGGYDETTLMYKTPSLVLKIGHSVCKCVQICRGLATEENNLQLQDQLENFLIVFNNRFEVNSSVALRTLHNNKFNKPLRLPLADDIRRLNIYLQDEIEKIVSIPLLDSTDLILLSKLTLCLIIAFNRKRSGECERIKKDCVEKMITGDINPDLVQHLDPFEQELARILSRFETRGKRGRKVPILLTPLMKNAVALINNHTNRLIMGIVENNEYFFPIPGT